MTRFAISSVKAFPPRGRVWSRSLLITELLSGTWTQHRTAPKHRSRFPGFSRVPLPWRWVCLFPPAHTEWVVVLERHVKTRRARDCRRRPDELRSGRVWAPLIEVSRTGKKRTEVIAFKPKASSRWPTGGRSASSLAARGSHVRSSYWCFQWACNVKRGQGVSGGHALACSQLTLG